ncbi:MAG: twitching motility protein PilT [Thermodesulfovibrio sp. RBG_19FT_COMBO_42_12]|nr:MAG: twitching motility protein PilT [Thermodesulfovibrio sp. RBG_19FT_COMBO_42_12]
MFFVLRLAVLLLFIFSGYIIGAKYNYSIYGVLIGGFLGLIVIATELIFKKIEFGAIIGGLIGISFGLLFAYLLMLPLRPIFGEDTTVISFVLLAVFGYGGLLLGLSRGKGISIAGIFKLFREQGVEEDLKILDTSVIIDGRIADVCETGFIEGVFIIPQFILQELQHIADAPDTVKRARGRRGLDILHKIQKMSRITVKIVDENFPKIKEVDAKLVALAKLLNAKVITNDFNLNKVAELQGVSVLNINELANSLKPVVLPGEIMKVFILKEGKEYNQGVAYLDDGTMVVVENGRRLIGKNADVTVTSVLQTTAGRMIFSKLKEDYEREEIRVAK